jgi:S1-C subfamily serine protease
MNRLKLPLMILAATALLAGLVAFGANHQAGQASAAPQSALAPAPSALALQNDFVTVYRKVAPSVVQIETSEGLGSGIVFDSKGHIVTNAHVVGTSKNFTVTTSKGRQLKATLVGTFPTDDLAVIKVSSASGLQPALFGNSSELRVGDIAMAIGNPLGLSSSVTQGIVSALHRTSSEGQGVTLPDTIQTSAPINPGNSGGALTDIQGRVIGIPTLAASDPQLGGAAAGIGFAIPSNTVKDIAGQIVTHGKVVNSNRAYLGINIGDTGSGVYVAGVSAKSPAAKAGIRTGDVITAVAGQSTPTSDALGTVLAAHKPGQTVKVKITRQTGGSTTVDVKLGEYPGS